MANPKLVYQIKVTLTHIKPAIWRRILVPENTTLAHLHDILQITMGWADSHLNMFTIDGQVYGDPADDEFGISNTKNETRFRLNQLALTEKAKFDYEYDFGDGWEHKLLVEKIIPAEKGVHYPICLAGKRACPPEDVGGPWGYLNLLEIMSDPEPSAKNQEILDWLDDEFDPEEFDRDGVNEYLRALKPQRGGKKASDQQDLNSFQPNEYPPSEDQKAMEARLLSWFEKLDPKDVQEFESLPLRRDMLVFLIYLSENRVVGTASLGNLPLKAVREICKNFVNPPELDSMDGLANKLRSESDVWPLSFLHFLATFSNMINGGPGKVWVPTIEGQIFQNLPAPVQVFVLFVGWCLQGDWLVAFQGSYPEDYLPDSFIPLVLTCLKEIPVGEYILFTDFVDRLLEKISQPGADLGYIPSRQFLFPGIEQMVVEPMTSFGVLECEYSRKNINNFTYPVLESICLTRTGAGLLELLLS